MIVQGDRLESASIANEIRHSFGPTFIVCRTESGKWALEQLAHHGWRLIVFRGTKMIGVLSYRSSSGHVESYGTFVGQRYRHLGIALQLWAELLRHENPHHVSVTAVSDYGLTLAKSLKRRYPHVVWKIDEAGARKLRVMVA